MGHMPAVGVGVHYDVGFRSEPEQRTGFAHLFEHLMFQGSESVARLEHFQRVQAAGGTANGSTHQDYTDYYQVVPAAALEQVLFLEADRMRAPRLTEESLRTQVEVVKEEIRLNVLNRPYGGFPWTVLPGVLYDTYPNAHNGYGDFRDLERATLDECAAFFDTYYSPANAVLTIAGDFDPVEALALVRRHFEDIPARPRPAAVPLAEPPLTGARTGEHPDRHAPAPALAAGYRMPDPATELDAYLAQMLLSTVLTGAPTARLKRRLLHDTRLVTDVSTGCGLFGALTARAPDTFLVVATHDAATAPERILDVLDEELADLAAHGPRGDELTCAAMRATAGLHRKHDGLEARTRSLGALEVLYGRAELVDQLPDRLAAVTADQLASAAVALSPDARAVLRLVPTSRPADQELEPVL
ncbi:insulinase family protein [Streptomyces kaniharaensis]|uniref:Insulinase family protein n=1 Tax=Streptomyces kaniharaensis TaxID=212423 RepID=A0A6N7KNA2_9ACTN|nr:pitrilysin family protein [Streptomyces kaniharaensis]MQS12986.1 insulinase family protein [Streptomyces kaniharaensis]